MQDIILCGIFEYSDMTEHHCIIWSMLLFYVAFRDNPNFQRTKQGVREYGNN